MGTDSGQLMQSSGVDGYLSSLLTVLLSLAVIIVLIVLFIKLLSRKNRMWQMNQSIRTLGGTGLGPNKSMQIVEVGDVVYVLGIGEDITLIDKISDPAQAARFIAALEREQPTAAWPTSWSEWKERLRFGRNGRTIDSNTKPEETESVSFHELFHEKLERMPKRSEQVEQLLKDDIKEDR